MDFQAVLDAYNYFYAEYEEFKKELDVKGKILVQISARIPGLSEYHYAQMSEISAICDYIEIRYDQEKQKARKIYLENYQRSLSGPQVENYADNHPDVVVLKEIMIQMKYILDLWKGLSCGLERLHHQLKTISEVRRAGLDDITI